MPTATIHRALRALAFALLGSIGAASAQTAPPAPPGFDADLARSVGADELGMRHYVLVVLKTGPNKMPAGPDRDAMFRGHFANIKRLAGEGKLALAGPFDGSEGWRGLFIFAVSEIDEARQLVATDPVISSGEMVPEFHKFYGAAALMLLNGLYPKVAAKPM